VSRAGREPSAATTVVGVIGDPVAHSLSPRLHNAAFDVLGLDWVSLGFRVRAGRAAGALAGARALGIRGLSVTMPHKEDAAGAVDTLTASAARLGAVNCVRFEAGGVVGDNTDGPGLLDALARGHGFNPAGRRCLVVGAGGAARAAVAALAEAGAGEIVVVNRTGARADAAVALAGSVGRVGSEGDAAASDLVVNATPLGMGGLGTGGPAAGAAAWPVDPALLHEGQIVVDLVYHPPRTPWLEAAADRGATVANGLGMLVHQAARQLVAWTGRDAPVEAMWLAVRDEEARVS
jgi:shikimate dehydrogenase